MSIILKGIDLPEPIKENYTYIELYVRSDGVVFDDDFEEIGKAIQIPKDHGRIIDESEIWFDHSVARSLDDGHNWDELVATKDGICGVPTILEAEE